MRLNGQERKPIRSESKRGLMNGFQTIKKLLVLIEIELKTFDKQSFKSGEVERSTSSGKDREFGVTVLAGTGRILQKMLSNSRVMGGDLRSVVFLAGMRNFRLIFRRMMVFDQTGNMLLDAFLQPLGSTSSYELLQWQRN